MENKIKLLEADLAFNEEVIRDLFSAFNEIGEELGVPEQEDHPKRVELMLKAIKALKYDAGVEKKPVRKVYAEDLKPFDRCLVRNGDGEWEPAFYGKKNNDPGDAYPFMCLSAFDTTYEQCIPYEGNEEMVGTTRRAK